MNITRTVLGWGKGTHSLIDQIILSCRRTSLNRWELEIHRGGTANSQGVGDETNILHSYL